MPISLRDFVAAVLAGEIECGGGGRRGRILVDGMGKLRRDDADAVTAEAYNQGVIRPTVPWATARARVEALLATER